MKLVIFGATGRTGIPFIQQALQAGHEIVAFVRTSSKMPIQHEHLTLVQGDVMNLADVQKAISANIDVVISVLAPVKGSPPDMLPIATQNIITTMQDRGIKRLIFMTGAGVDMPGDQPKFINHIIKFALKTISGAVLEQSVQAVNIIRNSNLHWTIVRAPRLTEGVHTGQVRVGMVGVDTGSQLARADAADFILKQVSDNTYIHQGPMITN